jgi:hypothetical protein
MLLRGHWTGCASSHLRTAKDVSSKVTKQSPGFWEAFRKVAGFAVICCHTDRQTTGPQMSTKLSMYTPHVSLVDKYKDTDKHNKFRFTNFSPYSCQYGSKHGVRILTPKPFQVRLQRCKKRILTWSCPSVCLSAWNNSAPTSKIFTKFDI